MFSFLFYPLSRVGDVNQIVQSLECATGLVRIASTGRRGSGASGGLIGVRPTGREGGVALAEKAKPADESGEAK